MLFIQIVVILLFAIQYSATSLPDASNCGVTHGCFRQPENCNGADCLFLYKWQDDGDFTHIELNGKIEDLPLSQFWLGFCLSSDKQMGNDDAHICMWNDGTVATNPTQIATVEHYRTTAKVRPGYLYPADPKIGLSGISVALENDIITCRFTRAKAMNSIPNYADIAAQEYHVLAAHGRLDVRNGVPNTIFKHTDLKVASDETYDFTMYKKRHVCQARP